MLAQSQSAIISGIGITAFGYYNPCIIIGPALMPIGAGLLSTLTIDAGRSEWIGYQAISGFGAGTFITA